MSVSEVIQCILWFNSGRENDCKERPKRFGAILYLGYWLSQSLQFQKTQNLYTDGLYKGKLGPFDLRTLQAMDSLSRTLWLCRSISKADKLV
ncbi:hypothetical protein N7465_003900 [Penicillium sp. CMV-2018d]|nr:hypothetical protein N7465_003900 [Penicillium sp. CMV-2018d]